MKKIFLCMAILIVGTSTAKADYLWDDGGGESSIGAGSTNLGWLTQFNVTAGNEIINNVQVAFGTGAAGNNINGMSGTAYIWNDPNGDGNPNDATFITSSAGIVSGVNTALPLSNTFVTFGMPNTNVGPVGTSFFVGFILNGMSTTAGANFPAAIDQSGNQTTLNRTWATFNSAAGGINPNDWSAAVNLTDINTIAGLGGRWMVRAGAFAIPEPSSSMLLLGLIGLFSLVRRSR